MSSGAWAELGRVQGLARFPLKGTGGENVNRIRLGWHGLREDRKFALLRTADTSGLPWASPREFPALVAWRSAIYPGTTDLVVTMPYGETFQVPERDAAAREQFARTASEVLGASLQLALLWNGTFDSMKVSVISSATIAAAGALVEDPDIDVRRFRANIIIDTDAMQPWIERKWIGRELRIGAGADACVLRVDRATARCQVINLDPVTGQSTYELFDAVRAANKNQSGVYATPVHVGSLDADAPVYIR